VAAERVLRDGGDRRWRRGALRALPDAGHFDVIDPLSAVWPAVRAEFLSASGLTHT
jgi:hypothetical protein